MVGEEVVQLYIAVLNSQVERASKELKAFTRVALASGESRSVQMEVPITDLAYYNEEQGWVVERTSYVVIIGQHTLDHNALRATFSVE